MALVNFSGNMQIGAGAISDQQVASNAAIAPTKLQHAYYARTNFLLKITDTPVTREDIVHVANAAGTVLDFKAMLNIVPSSGNVVFDLHKNGVSILTATITIDNTITNRQDVVASIATPTYIVGDVFSIVATATAPTGAQGPLAWMGFSETSVP